MKIWAIAFLLILGLVQTVSAQTRHAFVVGIDNYENVGSLAKARNDARAVAGALEEIGFRTQLLIDADETALLTELTRFSGQLDPGDEVVFYFAGHGVEIDGRNYLLPADVPSVQPGQELVVTRGALPVSDVIDQFNARGVRLSLLILDACRDNPFETLGTRSLGRSVGLGREEAPEGTFVMFSAGAGQQALDRLSTDDPNPNSVFTRVLLPRLTEPGLPLRTMVREVRSEVRALGRTVAHEQFPAVYDQLDGAFTFVPGVAVPAVDVIAPQVPEIPQPGTVVATDPCAAARADWSLIGETPSVALLEAYSAAHGGCPLMIALASERLAALSGNPSSPPAVAPAPAGTPTPTPTPEPQVRAPDAAALVQACVAVAGPDNVSFAELQSDAGLTRARGPCREAWDAITDRTSPEGIEITALVGLIAHARGSYSEAASFYETAARAGNVLAMRNLGRLYEEGQGVAENDAEAARLYQRGIEAGDAASARLLGVLYYHGRGVPQDRQRASRLFLQAAEAGDPGGMRNAGVMYRNGIGVAVNYAEAMRWYQAAVAAGDDFAHIYVGWMHQYGYGVPTNAREAARWFLSGLAAGHDHPIRHPDEFNGAVGRELQSLLRDAGFYNGAIDGAVGAGTVAAMQAYLDAN